MMDHLKPTIPRLGNPIGPYLADAFYERLESWIAQFESTLDPDHEVGARLVSFGQSLEFHLTDMSYWNPQLIRFDGVDNAGQRVELIQHVSQISVLLVAMPKRGETAIRLGFGPASGGPAPSQ
jgi:hypothetical protein